METSDSEYFESADESIESDDELDKKVARNNSKTPTSVPSCTLDASKVIITKELEFSETKDETVDNIETNLRGDVEETPKDLDNVSSNFNKLGITNDQDKNRDFKVEGEIDSNELQNPVQKDDYKNNSKQQNRSVNSLPLGQESSEKCEKIVTPVTSRELQDQSKDVKSMVSGNELNQCVDDENLWDDEELDWGTEGQLESEAKENINAKSIVHDNIVSSPTNDQVHLEKDENKISQQHQADSWGGWSSWGVSVLSTATNSVSSITSQLTNVIESGLGAVDPEEMAKINKSEQRKTLDPEKKQEQGSLETDGHSSSSFALGNFVKFVENTGTKVISGGLDTLETIGKKTMEVLQEGDPGLKKKRALLKIDQDKPVLSQILREAKEKAEREASFSESEIKKAKNYETLFDDHHGLVHLEALELLSKQCDIKLKSIQNAATGEQYTDIMETLTQIKELCELPDEEDEEQLSLSEIESKIQNAVTELNVTISYEKLLTYWKETDIWLNCLNMDVCDDMELHQQAIETLARITSLAMEQFHKIGELLLIKERRSTADEADSLVQITTSLICLIGIIAAKYSEKLNGKTSTMNKNVTEFITNVFFEAANSSSYIQDAVQLLIPVLQVGAL